MQQTIPYNDGFIQSYVGSTPTTGPFYVDFPFFSLNDVLVTRRDNDQDVQTVLVRGADYDLVGVPTEDGSFSSGTVTLYLAAVNTTIVRFRNTPVERLSNFPLQGFFSRLALNADLNRITVCLQELHSLLDIQSEANVLHAPLVSPTFLGNPRAPTPEPFDNDTTIATTAFVYNLLSGIGSAIPVGTVTDYAGAAAPAGWLLCDSTVVSRTTYSALFAVISTAYNLGGEDIYTFRLPDLRGRVTASADSSGSNRLSVVIPNSWQVGASGGNQTHTLTAGETGPHVHVMGDHAHGGYAGNNIAMANAGAGYGYLNEAGSILVGYNNTTGLMTSAANTASAGGGAAHNNIQPTMIMNKIIKY